MTSLDAVKRTVQAEPKRWLVTGVAGFIGSNLLEFLLQCDQTVTGLDNFSTGLRRNLDDVRKSVGEARWKNFQLFEGDVALMEDCTAACAGAHFVLHQAALGSVPRSIANPQDTNRTNITGFLNMLIAARDQRVRRLVYASSGSVYGDSTALPKVEDVIGRPLSPYAVTKRVNELYAEVFGRVYGFQCVGLRYFNVFGKRQSPAGPYAAVIPIWVSNLLQGRVCTINGDGSTTRDFCYVENVIQANLLAATAEHPEVENTVFNIGTGEQTALRDLYYMIRDRLVPFRPQVREMEAQLGSFRAGDVRHSQADFGKARSILGYEPQYPVSKGLDEAIPWYVEKAGLDEAVSE